MLRKGFLVFWFACCLCLSSYAAEISVSGYGNTAEEAQENALERLMSSFSGTVAFFHYSSADGQDQSQGSSYEVVLPVIEFSKAKKTSKSETEQGKYKVIAQISDTKKNIQLYVDETRNYALEFNSEYSTINSGNDFSDDEMIEHQYALYKSYISWMICHGIALELGAESSTLHSTDKQINVNNLISDLKTKIRARIDYYEAELVRSSLIETIPVISQLNKFNLLLRLLGDTASEQVSGRLLESKASALLSRSDMTEYSMAVASLYEVLHELSSVKDRFEAFRESTEKAYTKELNKQVKEIKNRKYSSVDTDKDGNPTPYAAAKREKEIAALTAEVNSALESAVNDSELLKSLETCYGRAVDAVNSIHLMKFSVSLSDGDFERKSVVWNPETSSWDIVLLFRYLEDDNIRFSIPFNTIAGYKPVVYDSSTAKDGSYDAFDEDVKKITSVLTGEDFYERFTITGTLHISYEATDNSLCFAVSDLTVRDTANKKFRITVDSSEPLGSQKLNDRFFSCVTLRLIEEEYGFSRINEYEKSDPLASYKKALADIQKEKEEQLKKEERQAAKKQAAEKRKQNFRNLFVDYLTETASVFACLDGNGLGFGVEGDFLINLVSVRVSDVVSGKKNINSLPEFGPLFLGVYGGVRFSVKGEPRSFVFFETGLWFYNNYRKEGKKIERSGGTNFFLPILLIGYEFGEGEGFALGARGLFVSGPVSLSATFQYGFGGTVSLSLGAGVKFGW